MTLPDIYRRGEVRRRTDSSLAFENGVGGDADRINLRAIISIFRRRLGSFLAIVGICVLLALLVTLRSPKLYTANADVVINADSRQVTPGTTGEDPNQPQRAEQIETELELLQSRDLAGKVLDHLNLAADPDFRAELQGGGGSARWLRSVLGLGSAATVTIPLETEAFRKQAIDHLQANLTARRIGTAYAMRIGVTDTNPARAARIANGFAEVYSADQIAGKVNDNRQAIGILQSRMEVLRKQAQDDFNAVQQYRIKNGLLSVAATSLTEQEISTYNQQVALARSQAAEERARLNTARAQLSTGTGKVGEATASPVVQSLRSQRAMLSAKVADLSNRYLDTHPELISAREQLADIDAQIAAEVNRTLYALDASARSAEQRLASLEGSLGAASSKLAGNNNALVALNGLERTSEASQALYESYLNRYKEAVAQSGAERATAKLLSAATIPQRPSSPNLPLNLALGLTIGILVGAASAIALENAYSGLTTGDDVESRLGVRYLGGVPLNLSIDPRGPTTLDTIEQFPGGAMAEATRNVLTSVRQATASRNQVIAVSSALPGEGKTTLAASLARVAGLGGERVILIDCDVVRRALSTRLGDLSGRPGLYEVLNGTAPLDEAILRDPVGGVAILPITTPFARGERLMEKGRLNRAIAKMREQFDLIIIDCAPVLPIAEAREVVTLADNVVIAVQWRKTSDYAVKSALRMLPIRTLPDIGIVLNQIDMRKRARFGYGDASVFYPRYKNYYVS